MEEKRKYKRIPIGIITEVHLPEKDVKVRLANLSQNGALFVVEEDPDNIFTNEFINTEICFTFVTEDKSEIKYHGKIVRIIQHQSSKQLGIQFDDVFFF
ncbi:MAG: PilZ domain-containing protein [Spirochaetes bacterium]|nr:PilZ domain-containing protein [Spirochaetota bacterium]